MKHWDDLIWKKIDGTTTPEEKEQLLTLEDNPAFRARYMELQAIHESLSISTPFQPSMRFTKSVMERLPVSKARRTSVSLLSKRWWMWAVPGIFMLLILPLYWGSGPVVESQLSTSVADGASFITNMISSVPSVFIWLITGVFSLFMLDEYVLKHYLRQKGGKTPT